MYSTLSLSSGPDDEDNFPKVIHQPTNYSRNSLKALLYDDLPVVSNISSAILGVSIFAMPWGFLQSGLLGGAIITIFLAFLSFETARILLACQKQLYQKTGEVMSYPEIASETLGGPIWGTIVKIATVISCLGSCVGYLIFLFEIAGQLFDISYNYALLFAVFPLTLLAWIRSFRELTILTTVGVLAIIATVIFVVYDGQHGRHGNVEPKTNVPLFIPATFLNFVGPATFVFTSHYCVLSMGTEALQEHVWTHDLTGDSDSTRERDREFSDNDKEFLKDKLKEKGDKARTAEAVDSLNRPVAFAYALSALLIMVHGASGFALFRSVEFVTDSSGQIEPGCEGRVCQNIILNLSAGPVRDGLGLVLCVGIVVSYVLLLAPAREHVEGGLLKYLGPCSDGYSTLVRNALRMALVVLTALVSSWAPYFGTLLGQVGGLTDALQAFVLPPLIYLSLQSDSLSLTQQVAYRAIFFWGLGTMIYTLTSLIQAVFLSR